MVSSCKFKLIKREHLLLWFGAEHTRDPRHPQFQELGKLWNEFVVNANSPLVVVENDRRGTYASNTEAIRSGGEIGFMMYLAAQAGVLVKCFEPNRREEMNHIEKLFGREKTEYYYFARTVAQWHRVVQKGSIEEYVVPYLDRDRVVSDWDDFDFSLSHITLIHKQLFGTKLDFSDKEFFLKIENPTRTDNPLQEVVQVSGEFRDQSVVRSVRSAWVSHDIFMVYGVGHLEAHRRGLEAA